MFHCGAVSEERTGQQAGNVSRGLMTESLTCDRHNLEFSSSVSPAVRTKDRSGYKKKQCVKAAAAPGKVKRTVQTSSCD